MIVAELKPLDQITALLNGYRSILLAGCGECVTVCSAGGEKEVQSLAAALRLWYRHRGVAARVHTVVIQRQCEPEFLAEADPLVAKADCVLSLGCGVGVQFLAERHPQIPVFPALDTKFAGGTVEPGWWGERCGLCGDCILHLTGGICPIIRCSKSLLNGPCGGSQGGRCEVNEEIECAWQLIYDRLKGQGRLEELEAILPPKDWSRARDGGPRRVIREDLRP